MRGQFLSTIVGGVIGGCVVLGLQGGLATAHSTHGNDTVAVRQLNVLDSHGKVRISLRCDSNDAPRIRMHDSKGSMRCAIGLGNEKRNEGPFLYMIDSNMVKADLSVAEDGAPTLFLNGRDGKPRIFMCASPSKDGELSQLVVYGNKQDTRSEILATEGRTGLSSYKDGVMRTYSGIMPAGMAGMMVDDAAGNPGTIIGITSDDKRVMTRLEKGDRIDMATGQSQTDSQNQK
ncbi:MAG: hypothetical protein JSS83_16060 [Cyanobacteria bacterium SZAS LIN-3]|nr:hypothetical protein [Cyanobacteria bacterium SZAS LIN-3]